MSDIQPAITTSFSEELLNHIKATVAPTASPEEFFTFIHLCKSYGLDPLKKEIYFIKYGSKATIITSRDGYLKIANNDPFFNGLESDAVYESDTLVKRDNGSLLITYGPDHMAFDKSKLKGAFCNVFRKDRDVTTSVFVSIKDHYKKDSSIWQQYTNAMIIKVAESMALKRSFSISGLSTKEELDEQPE